MERMETHVRASISEREFHTRYEYLKQLHLQHPLQCAASLTFAVFLAVHGRWEEAADALADIVCAYTERRAKPELSRKTLATLVLLGQSARSKVRNVTEQVLESVQQALALSSSSCAVLTKAAELLAACGVTQEAEQLFLGALTLDSTNNKALHAYGRFNAQQGRLKLALKYLRKVRYPKDGSHQGAVLVEIGGVLELLNLQDHAEHVLQAYSEAASRSRRDEVAVEALACLGHFYHVRGDDRRAMSFYERALMYSTTDAHTLSLYAPLLAGEIMADDNRGKTFPGANALVDHLRLARCDALYRRALAHTTNPNLLWMVGLSYAEFLLSCAEDIEQAESALLFSVLHARNELWPLLATAQFYQLRQRLEAAHSYFRTALSHHERDSSACTAYGYFLLSQDKEQEAHEMFNEALAVDSTYPPALRGIAVLMWRKGSPSMALSVARQAREQASSNPYVLRTLAIMLWQDGKRREAHRVAVEATGLNPQHTPTLVCLAIMTYLCGDSVGAEEVFREAVRITRWRHPEVLRLWAQVCLELEMYEEARVAFERLHCAYPSEPLTMLGYAMTLLGHGEPSDAEQASRLLEKVAQLPQSPPEVFYAMGMHQLRLGDMAEAKRQFQNGAQCTNAPPNPLCTYMLGRIAEQEGDLRMAEKLYVWALETEPVRPSTFLRLLVLIDEHHASCKAEASKKATKSKTGKRSKVQTKQPQDSRLHVLHKRVKHLADLRSAQLEADLAGQHPAGDYVWIDPLWEDEMFRCFECGDDWGWLLRSRREFRAKNANT